MTDPSPIRSNAAHARARHRARQHDSAHADASAQGPQKIIDHPLIPRAPGELITAQPALNEMIDHLRQEKSFAYDSEFIGELTYNPHLCLLQVATTKRIGLIDPLAKLDLTPLWELLADGSVRKILHAGEQDVEPVHRLIGKAAANVFDTQISAGFVGLAYPIGLSKLVHELIGTKLGKGLTFTHWDQRPLSPMQLSYASDDVRYLPAVAAMLQERLDKLGHADWAREECDSVCDPKWLQFDPDVAYMRIRGASSLPPQQLAVLRELTIWRDAAAQKHDLPPRAFLRDEILLDLARSPVKMIEKLDRVKGLPRPVEEAHGATIVEVTLRGLATPPSERPEARHNDPSPTERFAADSLYVLMSAICAGRSIDPALVASRQDIGELYRTLKDGGTLPDLRLLKGWRAQACGNALLDLFKGQTNVRLEWLDGGLHATL